MSTVLDALRKAQDGDARGGAGGLGDEPPRPPRKGGPRFLWIILGLIALVGAFAGGLELSGGGSPEPTDEEVAVTETVVEPVEVAAVAKPEPPPPPPARTEPTRPPPQERVPVARREPRDVEPAPTFDNAPAAVQKKPMSEKRRRVLERVMERRAQRDARRENRFAQREESVGLREAIRSAGTPEERDALLEEFREIRRIARAERKATSAEHRVQREEERIASGAYSTSGVWDPTAGRPKRDVEPAPGVRPAPAPAPAIVRAPPPAPAAVPPPESGKPLVLSASGPTAEGLRRPPSSAPQVRINILQYSNDPGRRFAYMSVEGNPAMTQVREGENYQGLTVKRIFPEQVEFAHQGATFLLRAN